MEVGGGEEIRGARLDGCLRRQESVDGDEASASCVGCDVCYHHRRRLFRILTDRYPEVPMCPGFDRPAAVVVCGLLAMASQRRGMLPRSNWSQHSRRGRAQVKDAATRATSKRDKFESVMTT